ATASTPGGEGAPLSTLAELEKRHILSVLEHCKGNRTHAAKLLDVSIRTLRNKLHEYNNTQPGSDSEDEALVEGS
ncbi:MAG TPA: helix-turn-helix domain-containing protein, partial [Bacillota bacterium]|nr:helix-turn-helix domain-containing protein [Bacillota bacterium]